MKKQIHLPNQPQSLHGLVCLFHVHKDVNNSTTCDPYRGYGLRVVMLYIHIFMCMSLHHADYCHVHVSCT